MEKREIVRNLKDSPKQTELQRNKMPPNKQEGGVSAVTSERLQSGTRPSGLFLPEALQELLPNSSGELHL